MSDQAVAKKLGVNRRTLFRWRQLPGFPGTEDMKKLRTWAKGNEAKRKEPGIRPGPAAEQTQAADPTVTAPKMNAENRLKLQQTLNSAFDGSAPWLDALVKQAGYTRGLLVTTQQLGELVGKSAPTIANWKKNGMPKLSGAGQRGAPAFDLGQVFPWLIEYYQGREQEAREAAGRGISKAEERKKAADAELAEMKIAKQKEQLLPTVRVDEELALFVMTFRERIMAIPSALAAILAPETDEAKIKEVIESELTAALGELSEYRKDKKE